MDTGDTAFIAFDCVWIGVFLCWVMLGRRGMSDQDYHELVLWFKIVARWVPFIVVTIFVCFVAGICAIPTLYRLTATPNAKAHLRRTNFDVAAEHAQENESLYKKTVDVEQKLYDKCEDFIGDGRIKLASSCLGIEAKVIPNRR